MPKDYDSDNSSTQDSAKVTGSPGKPYTSGANVGKGGGPKPSKEAPAAQPKGGPY